MESLDRVRFLMENPREEAFLEEEEERLLRDTEGRSKEEEEEAVAMVVAEGSVRRIKRVRGACA